MQEIVCVLLLRSFEHSHQTRVLKELEKIEDDDDDIKAF